MKKLLAFILAVTMIATLIPSAFADGGAEENGEKISIVCNLESIMNTYTAATKFSQINADANGAFKYVRSSLTTSDELKDGVVGEEKMVTSGNTIRLAGVQGGRHFRVFKDHYICFEITIPQNGYYSMDVLSQKSKSGQDMEVFVTDTETFYRQSSFSLNNLGVSAGKFCTHDANSTYNETSSGGLWANENVFIKKYFYAGRYVITFSGIGGYTPYTGKVAHTPIRNFTLEGTPVEEKEPSGISIKYDIKAIMKAEGLHTGNEGTKPLVNVDYNTTNGFFDVISRVGTVSYASTIGTTYNFLKLKEGAQVVMNINVPVDGVYSLRTSYQQAKNGTDVKVYLDGSQTEVASYSCYSSDGPDTITAGSGSDGHWINDAIIAKDIPLLAGEHMIRFAVTGTGTKETSVGTFELITEEGEGTTDMPGFIKVDNTTLAVDETANILGAVACSSNGTVKAQSDTNTTYASSNTSVATVSGTTITAVGAGTADITTTVGDVEAKRTITVLNKEVSGNVSLGVYSDVDGYVTVMVDETASDVKVDSVAVGSWVKATAKTDDPDYIFRGWKRGSRDNGVWISEDTEIYFPIMTNTFLTAVYEPVAETEETVDVEFFNYNGQYLDTKEDVGDKEFSAFKPEPPSLTGYSNPFWTLDGENEIEDNATFKKLTRVVANYRNKDSFDVTIGDGLTAKISGTDTIAKSGEYDYDTVLILSSEKEGSWYIDGKLVAYGNAYALNVWNDAEITFDEKENNVPIIALDGETKANGARMISYDANGVNIAEVGIIFGKDAKITSFESKATAKKRGNSQGQFTAMPYAGDGKNARGYLIYNDKGTYRVIYAD